MEVGVGVEVTGALDVVPGGLDEVTGAFVVVDGAEVVAGQVHAGHVVGAAVLFGARVPAQGVTILAHMSVSCHWHYI